MFFAAPLALLPLFTLALVRLPALQPLSAQGPITPDATAAQLLALRLLPPHLAVRAPGRGRTPDQFDRWARLCF